MASHDLHPTVERIAGKIRTPDEAEVIAPDERAGIGEITVDNPAFDVTPPRYLDAIVTLMRELFGVGTTDPWVEPEREGDASPAASTAATGRPGEGP